MFGGPAFLLRRGPTAQRQAREDGRLQMLHGPEQDLRVRHLFEVAIEIAVAREALPKFSASVLRLKRLGAHAKQMLRPGIEVGKHPIAVEEEVRLPRHS